MKGQSKERIPSLISLKRIFEGTSEYTGTQFFRSLVKNLAQVLQVHGVWVTEFKETENKLNSLAFWLGGQFVDKYEYQVSGTPCEPVLKSDQICHVPDNVIELYPKDPDLEPLGAVSYMGLVLKAESGKVLGHLALLDQKPMDEIPEIFLIFKLFASRAQAEMRRLQYENRLKQSESKINRLLNGTMDAIIEFNDGLIITQANESALKTFQKEPVEFIGKPITYYLSESSFQQLTQTIPFLTSKSEPNAIWIHGYLDCIKNDKQTFPADATISSYEFEGEVFYALYIRDVNERIKKDEEIKRLTIETTLLKEKIEDQQFGSIIGESQAMMQVFQKIDQVASTDSTVLITGETGTGKELIAREIHNRSGRKEKTFIAVNCAALPSDLIESELFGHVKGAFTGATETRDGRFLLADKGTLFLDEIGELPLALQTKLLRVVQEGEFEPVGSSLTRRVDVRLLAATHRDLKQAVKEKLFREDLFYRLHVFPIHLPPLRDRDADVTLLAEAFLNKYARKHGRKITTLNDIDKHHLKNYSWPGNVRELQNVIERAVITAREGKIDLAYDLNPEPSQAVTNSEDHHIYTYDEIRHLEIRNIRQALCLTKGRIFGDNGAARLLGIPPTTLASKITKFDIGKD